MTDMKRAMVLYRTSKAIAETKRNNDEKLISFERYENEDGEWVTLCNQFWFYIAILFGYDIYELCQYVKFLKRKHHGYTRADHIYDNSKKLKLNGLLDQVSKEGCLKVANKGILTLVTAHGKKGGPGHVAIMKPDYKKNIEEYYVIQAGWENGVKKLSKMFPEKYVTEPLFYDMSKLKINNLIGA